MKNILIIVGTILALTACSTEKSQVQRLQNQLSEAQTAVQLSAQNTDRLQKTYSDIYFELNSLTVANFQTKVASKETFYVYIGRPSCSDCNAFEPMFKRYIKSRNLQNKIYFVNVHRLHENPEAWNAFKKQYNLSGTPTLAKYSKGQQINKLDFEANGELSEQNLQKWLQQNHL